MNRRDLKIKSKIESIFEQYVMHVRDAYGIPDGTLQLIASNLTLAHVNNKRLDEVGTMVENIRDKETE